MTVSIHATAIVDPTARLGDGVVIGPYCVVGAQVELGDRVRLMSHVVVEGRTRIGEGTEIYPFASIGHRPQDLKYHGEASELIVGARNQIRESVTMNPGTEGGGMLTTVGDDNLFMVGSHVAHDCHIGSHVIFANNATVGGHVFVGDYAILGGLSAVRQFVRVGAHAMIGGMSGVENDVIPYGLVMGERAHLAGLNLVGLERRGFDKDEVRDLRSAYRSLFAGAGTLSDRLTEVETQFGARTLVGQVLTFIRERTGNAALCQPKTDAN
jgi:UDP-N-acetylglucosamine acyltransferase